MKGFIVILLVAIIFFASIASVFARSGCCSHHNGVCGCGCCDGTPLSDTCAPYYPECNNAGSNNTVPANNTNIYTAPVYVVPTNTPILPTATPIPPTDTPTPTNTPIPTNSPTPIVNSQNTTKEVAGANTSSNNNTALTILVLLALAGIIGGIYFKNKKNKSKISPDNL
jgi:LPXTG-motif cell wall-anchored protein